MIADAAPSPPPPPPPQEATAVTWPRWFASFDLGLAVMATLLAFLSASFVARNADFWRHIAVGRLVTKFEYPVGGDPFTYTAANAVWVNPNWLSEVLLYVLYSVDSSGAIAVGVKAMAFAAAFAVLFLLRNPAFPLWSWAVAAATAAVGACSQVHLRPYVFGLVMLAVTLVVLFRGNWTTGPKWRRPLILGGVVALWANLDAFAFLGPLAVALVLIGELLHTKLFADGADVPAGEDPFPPVPPVPALGRALIATLVGLLLNPTFLMGLTKDPGEAVAQLLPFEADFATAEAMATDTELQRFTHAALHKDYYDKALGGKDPSGLFAAVVGAFGILLSAVGYRAGRTSHLLLWLGFALGPILLHARFIGPFMVVSVPFLAAHLNGLTGRIKLDALTAQSGRLVVQLSRLGRVATAVGLVVLMLLAIPGWLQPQSNVRAFDRWVAWAVEPEEGMQRAAGILQSWRTDSAKSAVLADTRGLNAGPDFGDYCAWFAPAEKSFADTRYRLHRSILPDLLAARQYLLYGKPRETETDRPVTAILEKHRAGYLCLTSVLNTLRPEPVAVARAEFEGMGGRMIRTDTGSDALWMLDGRFAVVGRTDSPEAVRRAGVMAWEPARSVFSPVAPRGLTAPPDLSLGLRPQRGWENDFFDRPPVNPVTLDDSMMYSGYAAQRQMDLQQYQQQQMAIRQQAVVPTLTQLGGVAVAFAASNAPLQEIKQLDEEVALPILAARSARLAIQSSPKSAEAYFALAVAHQQELMPEFSPGENRIQALNGYVRALSRLPAALDGEQSRYAASAMQMGWRLFRLHIAGQSMQDMHFDLARDALTELNRHAATAKDEDVRNVPVITLWQAWFPVLTSTAQMQSGGRIPQDQMFDLLVKNGFLEKGDNPEWAKDPAALTANDCRHRLKRLESSVAELARKLNDQVERLRGMTPDDKFATLIRLGLPGTAKELFEKLGDRDTGGALTLFQAVQLVGLLQQIGRLEEAYDQRIKLEAQFAKLAEGGTTDLRAAREYNRNLELTEAKLAGDYKKADALAEEQNRQTPMPTLTPAERAVLTGNPIELTLGHGAVGGVFHSRIVENWILLTRARLLDEALRLYNRGLFALLDGDTKLAKQHFDAAVKPQGIDLATLGTDANPAVNRMLFYFLPKYRELLEKYAK